MSQNILEMSDDEFEKLSGPPVTEEKPVEASTPAAEAPAPAVETEQPEAPAVDASASLPDPSDEEMAQAQAPVPKLEDPAAKKDAFKGEAPKPDTQKTDEPKAQDEGKQPSTDGHDYKAFYERVMAPFKANGKTVQLQSADEVVQLMQMGANYTKKMQELQPQKRLLMMLENNGLLDVGKLSFLIDLHQKNPEAIKKLLKDANIDPIEVDTTKVNYQQGNHAVSDQEAALQTAIEDLKAHDGGLETLQSINSWDQASKKVLWDSPALLQDFHTMRVNGVYTQITTEMERRRTLGQLHPNMPFLQAYKLVGDELAARGAFQPAPATNPGPRPAVGGAPVAVRPAVRTPPPKAADTRVRAAAPTRTTPRPAQVVTNYLGMSDEDFLKQPPPG